MQDRGGRDTEQSVSALVVIAVAGGKAPAGDADVIKVRRTSHKCAGLNVSCYGQTREYGLGQLCI